MYPDYGLVPLVGALSHRVPDGIHKPAVQIRPHGQRTRLKYESDVTV